jgi:hypothetical protein
MRAAILSILLLSLLMGCTQAARERAAETWCDSAPNCTVYDDNGRETSDRNICRGTRNCAAP